MGYISGLILNDDEDHETDESCEPDNDIIRGKLVDLVASFEAGPEFKHGFFRDTAVVGLLLPVAQLSQKLFHDTADLQAFQLLSANYSPLQLIRKESRHWLEAMY